MEEVKDKTKDVLAKSIILSRRYYKKALKYSSKASAQSKMHINKALAEIKKANNKTSSGRLSIKDQAFFIKRLSFLIKAGIPILESLHMIKDQTRSKNQIKILEKIIEDVSEGQSLSRSLSKYKKMFGEFSINIISFGEETGILSENLEYLADELQKRQALRKKIVGAFIYPAVVTLATLGITAFLMIYLFPKITPVFASLHAKLPLSTRIVIFLSNFVRNNGLSIFLVITLFVITFILLMKKSEKFNFLFDKYILKIPVIGETIKNYNLANSSRTLGLLLKSGITVSDAIPITSKTSGNLVYKQGFSEMSESINKGEKMSVYLIKRKDIFPEVLSQIVSVGEKSGSLSSSLIYLSEMYESEVDDFTKNISNVIEPVLMIFMGVLVGFIAISIITPIYGITQNLHG